MSTPEEKQRSLVRACALMHALAMGRGSVPAWIREEIRNVLRHFPFPVDIAINYKEPGVSHDHKSLYEYHDTTLNVYEQIVEGKRRRRKA